MDKNTSRALTEVLEVLKHTNKQIIEKIPEKFINFLFENSDKSYVPNIDFNASNWDDLVQEETKAILAIIYRDYMISEEERKALLLEEENERKKEEEALREKYNPDNLFKKRYSDTQDEVKNTQLAEVKQYSWYQRLYKKIIKIFKR